MVTSKVALTVGSSQHGKHRLALAPFEIYFSFNLFPYKIP